MNKLVQNYIQGHKDIILQQWIERVKDKADDRVVKIVSDQMFIHTSNEFIEVLISNIKDSDEEFKVKLSDFAAKIIRLGWPLTFVNEGLKAFNVVVTDGMVNEGVMTKENQLEIVLDFDEWITPLNNEILNVYTSTWERTVSLQKIALQELSAPLIPVFEGITVMPLIGTIDTERARQIMENLLDGVVKHRSEVVLIDITGVPVVDTMVAHHIIQAAEAVRLVGARCMLVGIRPEIAQTIVNLGINLDEIITKNTLKKGVEAALEITNRKIIVTPEELV
ncbi:STAS domain-containing protein [Pradoshia sp. D12]|uniref:RsbT co-antagonist protein RsbRA n=1 Tax=Bacillaceae TaxID=186817 RepID=UPI00080AE4EF|nr:MULTISPECIES: RsbT co-antagonist protein RsbRA [Bacillaceae]OCA89196.1 RsbR protein [Bacillus sp. FJAT-27986]QFK70003.1 STAS domain-containing protein [Pradoshia sp. D12]TPF70499.1 STAS domain-containing protein [Bacillus sp. D12]